MTDDLVGRLRGHVKRLRGHAESYDIDAWMSCEEAADRIEALEAALRHCVNAIAEVEKCKPELLTYEMAFRLQPFLLGAMDNARAALGEKKDER